MAHSPKGVVETLNNSSKRNGLLGIYFQDAMMVSMEGIVLIDVTVKTMRSVILRMVHVHARLVGKETFVK